MPTFIRPVAGSPGISCNFACHIARRSVNYGVDYAVATGTDVRAPAAGVVNVAQWSNLVGWWLGIDFDNGWGADLMHNSKLLVKPGTRVAEGQIIAKSGGTGSVATGPHVHWSLRPFHGWHLQNHGNVDPEKYLAGTAGGGTTPIPPDAAPQPEGPPAMTSLIAIAYSEASKVDQRIKDAIVAQGLPAVPNAPTPAFLSVLCGESPGTPANTLFTWSDGLATQMSANIKQSSYVVNLATFNAWVLGFMAPLDTDEEAGTVTVETSPAILEALNKIAAASEATLAATKALNPPG